MNQKAKVSGITGIHIFNMTEYDWGGKEVKGGECVFPP